MNIAACIDRHMTMWRPKKEQMRQLFEFAVSVSPNSLPHSVKP